MRRLQHGLHDHLEADQGRVGIVAQRGALVEELDIVEDLVVGERSAIDPGSKATQESFDVALACDRRSRRPETIRQVEQERRGVGAGQVLGRVHVVLGEQGAHDQHGGLVVESARLFVGRKRIRRSAGIAQ